MVWVANDKRDARVAFEICMLAPAGMIAKFPTVVGPENDDCVFGCSGITQGIQQHADVAVGVADARMISVDKSLIQFFREICRRTVEWDVAVR